MHRLVSTLALFLLLSPATPAYQAPGRHVQEADTALISLVDQLQSSNFRTRQTATGQLKQAGAKAIPILLNRVRTGRLELAARAMAIFEHAYAGRDEAATTAADVALESLAESKRQTLAEMANAVLQRNQIIRTRIAITHLKRLNADYWDPRAEARLEKSEVKNQLNQGPNRRVQLQSSSPPRLILDSEWNGGVDGLKYVRRLVGSDVHIYLVDGVPVPDAAKLELEASFPNGNVAPRGPVMLGVRPNAFGPGVVVAEVEKYSSAWQILKANDRLTKMDGEELEDFSDLIAILKRHKVGDKVVFEVETINDSKRQTTERVVTLKNWRLPRIKPTEKPAKADKPAP